MEQNLQQVSRFGKTDAPIKQLTPHFPLLTPSERLPNKVMGKQG
jgi:hypothetical protein